MDLRSVRTSASEGSALIRKTVPVNNFLDAHLVSRYTSRLWTVHLNKSCYSESPSLHNSDVCFEAVTYARKKIAASVPA
jgi:hypothetical protein